ncbi:MAG: M48 family metalloprotease [bacterium]|nr:M48 family metalloprotease [bacterium]
MKKIFISLFTVGIIALSATAAFDATARTATVGQTILTKNSLPATTTFKVTDAALDNSDVSTTNVIYIPSADLAYAGNDHEVAAVIANELGHIINGHYSKSKLRDMAATAITNRFDTENVITATAKSSLLASKLSLADNKEADITGVDLMIQAGYNPLAMIVTITKMPGSTLETLKGAPANSERAMYLYDYLLYNYPAKVKVGYNCQEYKRFLAYADPIVNDRNSNKKKLEKFNKQQEKYKADRAKKVSKYQATNTSGWDASFMILKSFTE